MKFKTLLAILTLTLFSFTDMYSQYLSLRGGLNIATVAMRNDDVDFTEFISSNFGFHFGATLGIDFDEQLGVEFGVLASRKGYMLEDRQSFSKEIYNPLYLDIPILGRYTANFGDLYVNFYGGPYIGFGIGGQRILEVNQVGDNQVRQEFDIEWGDNPLQHNLERMDMGLMIGAFASFYPFEIGLMYNYGVYNISPTDLNGTTINNQVLMITAAYAFTLWETSQE